MAVDLLTVIKDIAARLTREGLMLSVAESCTGGCVASAITALPGASRFFSVSVVSYSEAAKRSVLGVSGPALRKYGVVSEETAVAMARAVAKRSGTRVALAVTGNAGPGALEGKEVGLVYMAVVIDDVVESRGMILKGGRDTVRKRAAAESLRFLDQVMRVWR